METLPSEAHRQSSQKGGYDALEITAPFGENVQDFWILEQARLLSVEEALSDLAQNHEEAGED